MLTSYFKSFNSFINSNNYFYKYDVQKLQMTQTKQKCKDIITQNIANTNSCHWDEYKNIICDAATQTVESGSLALQVDIPQKHHTHK